MAAPVPGAAMDVSWKRVAMFTMQPQERSNWCWAAVAASVSLCADPSSPWTQCLVAQRILPSTVIAGQDCCEDGACDVPWNLESALRAVGRLQTERDVAASFAAVKEEIDLQRPLAVRFQWSDGIAHFFVIDGYLDDGSDRMHVSDSKYGSATITREALLQSYLGTSGRWTTSYWTR